MPRRSSTGVRGLYKDADGRYRIDLRWVDAKSREPRRHKERLPPGLPAAAAKKRAQDVLASALGGTLPAKGAKDAPRTLRAAFDCYLDDWVKLHLPERAYADRGAHADNWVATVGDVALTMVSPLLFAKFKKGQQTKGNAPSTILRNFATLRHMLGLAGELGWLPREHVFELRKKLTPKALKNDLGLREPDGRVRWLKDDERARLYAALEKNGRRESFHRVVLAALHSGQRLSNVIKLQKSAVDLAARHITLTKTKSGKTYHVHVNETLAGILETAMAESDGELVFVNSAGEPYTQSGVSSFFGKIAEEAKIPDFHFHDLRHDFATRLSDGGVRLDVISKSLGHSSLATTQRYAHVRDPLLRDAVSGLDKAEEAWRQRQQIVAPILPPAPSKRAKKSG
jgi:integrase